MKKRLLLLILAISLSGCISLGKAPPQQAFMLSSTKTINPSYTKKSAPSIQIQALSVLPQFSGTEFVYRTSETSYRGDYYHIFFIPPDQQLTQITTDQIQASGLFSAVGTNFHIINQPTYTLSGIITDFYADYRNKNQPLAIISIHYYLRKNSNGQIVMDRLFEEKVPLTTKSNEALINAWNQGINKLMQQLIYSLRGRSNSSTI